MTERIEGLQFDIARREDVEAHMHSLRELAKVANRAMNAMMAFELRIRFCISELDVALQQAAVTDLHRTKDVLTLSEAARKLGVSVTTLRNDDKGRFPKPIRGSSKAIAYRRAEVDDWLLRASQDET